MEYIAVIIFIGLIIIVLYFANKFNNKLDQRNREMGQNISKSAMQKRMDAFKEKCDPIIELHIETLARQYMIKVRKDKYGVEDRNDWDKEVAYFVERVISKQVLITEDWELAYIKDIVDLEAELAANDLPQIQDVGSLSPIEFEYWCSRELERAGWSVETTKASGDQGADVLAKKGAIVAVIQCKLYSNPVGNKAVQEAFAARTHYKATVAGVVTNAAYTRSAQELAQSTGVLLLHHSDLALLDARIETAHIIPGA